MEPKAYNSLLPPGTIHNYQASVLDNNEALQRADQIVKEACAKATQEYASSEDADALAGDLQRITALFSSLTLVNAQNFSQSRRVTEVDQDMTELTSLFSSVVLDLDEKARSAFEQGQLENAKRFFTRLSTAHQYHRGSERDHYIRACRFATDVKECTLQTLLVTNRATGTFSQNDETIRVLDLVVSQFLSLQQERTPDSLHQWKTGVGNSIVEFIKAEIHKNDAAVRDIWSAIIAESKKIEELLTAERLQGIEFNSLLADLHPIQERLSLLQANLTVCLKIHSILAKYCDPLGIENGANYQDVQNLVTNWIELTNSAIELLDNLASAETVESKNSFLLSWIDKHIDSYHNSPSALHLWAFSLLGKLFASQQLSQNALDESIALIRGRSQKLLTHSRALLVDVELQFGTDTKAINHLLLGVISGMLERSSCTVEKIKEMHTTWEGFPCVGRYIERVRTWATGERKIQVPMQIGGDDEPNTLIQRAKTLNILLEALQSNDFRPLENLTHEEVVALFEIAHYILEMPQDIVDLSIKRLDTSKLRKALGALLWLRFAQACMVDLPHTALEKLFEPLSKEDFLKWISLYNPERITINAQKHAMLFNALVNKADRLLLDEQLRLSDEEIEKITKFIADRYQELIVLGMLPAEKLVLDSGLIRLICLALTKAKNHAPYNEIKALESINSLKTIELERIKPRFGEAVIGWLEQKVYPNLHLLHLSDGLDSQGLGNIALCKNLLALAMPLPQRDSRVKIEKLAKFAPHIATLEFWGGEIVPEVFNHFSRLQNLSLKDIQNYLDFSTCHQFTQSVRNLVLENVSIRPGSLCWIASSPQLEQLSIKVIEDGTIGSLANDVIVHARPGFRTLTIDLTSFDRDPDLMASLPKLLDTFESLAHLTLKGMYSESLLLAIGKQGETQLEELTISWNQKEQIAEISTFERLKKLHCFTDSAEAAQLMRVFEFDIRPPQLEEWKVYATDGTILPIPIKVREPNRNQ